MLDTVDTTFEHAFPKLMHALLLETGKARVRRTSDGHPPTFVQFMDKGDSHVPFLNFGRESYTLLWAKSPLQFLIMPISKDSSPYQDKLCFYDRQGCCWGLFNSQFNLI